MATDPPDFVVLDLMMPGSSGFEVARSIRKFSSVPILILSVRIETTAKLEALDAGADDYLAKPFRVEELLARVRAILRRTAQANPEPSPVVSLYQSGGLEIDFNDMRVTDQDRRVQLTPKEWDTLRVLVRHVGQVVPSHRLLEESRGSGSGSENGYVRTYITRLRRKLEPDPSHPRYILLERGLSYRLTSPE